MEIKGKYNTITVFNDNVEYDEMDQMKRIANCRAFSDATIKVMPDHHCGSSCVVGYTQTVVDKVVPNLVGVDISCGMSYAKIPAVDLPSLDKSVRAFIPAGSAFHNPNEVPNKLKRAVENIIGKLTCKLPDDSLTRILNSIGTLGGGNHFIEVDRSVETGDWYIVVHSGSRNLGLQVCRYWQNRAIQNLKDNKYGVAKIIDRLKREGRESEIPARIEEIKSQNRDIPSELAYLEGEDMLGYLHDMDLVDQYAVLNRQTMIETIANKIGVGTHKMKVATTKHNYIDQKHRMLRKGAIAAYADEEVLIPFNMRDGAVPAIGKGNADWNYSAPHGAGRLMSRGMAKELITLDEFVQSMEGIYTSSVSESTLDESPMVYKDASEIEALIEPTVEVREHLKPLYNFKAGN